MLLTDTHTHLYSESFEEDRHDMVKRAIDAGVQTMLLPNIDLSSIGPLTSLVNEWPENIFGMMGLHPCSVGADVDKQLSIIKTELYSGDYLAVGEMGVDLYWDQTYLEEQKHAFRTQVAWAKELDLPVVLHVRDAFEEVFALMDELNDDRLRGVFHCFTGGESEIKRICDFGGFYFGIGGVITYKKSGLSEIAPLIPEKLLLLETDSPYLPPTPHRGKRNESSYLTLIAQRFADSREVSIEHIAEVTTANARELFRI